MAVSENLIVTLVYEPLVKRSLTFFTLNIYGYRLTFIIETLTLFSESNDHSSYLLRFAERDFQKILIGAWIIEDNKGKCWILNPSLAVNNVLED